MFSAFCVPSPRERESAPLRRVLLWAALFLGCSFSRLTSAFAPVWCKPALFMAISRQKIPTATAVGFGSIIICRCSQRTAKRMIQQHTGDNIPIGVNRTVSNRLRYPLLSYQLFQNIHLLFQILPGIILRLQLLPAATRLSRFIRSFLSHSSQHQFIQFERHLPDYIIIKCLGLDISKVQFLIQLFGSCVVLDYIKPQCFPASFSLQFNHILH